MTIREDKRMVKLDFILFQNCYFLAYIKKISTFTFGAWSFLSVPHPVTPREEPKKSDYEVGQWKKAVFHDLTSWSMV